MIHRTGKFSATPLYSPNTLPHVVAVVGERVMTSGASFLICSRGSVRDLPRAIVIQMQVGDLQQG